MTFVSIAGSGKSILWFVGFEILLLIVADVVRQLHDHPKY